MLGPIRKPELMNCGAISDEPISLPIIATEESDQRGFLECYCIQKIKPRLFLKPRYTYILYR